MNSIRLRLLVWQTGAFAVATLLISLITYQLAWDGFNRVRDFALEQIAYSILQYGVEPIGSPNDVQFVSQIWNTDGSLKFSSRPELLLPRQPPGQHRLDWRGEEWHIYTLTRDEATVQVANSATNRLLMFAEISPWLLLPLAMLIFILGGLLSLAVHKALQPLKTIQEGIAAQELDALRPLPPAQFPREITPLVGALNTLLTRLDRVLSDQRRFVADAAHELRTPLTAIKLQTQIALASPTETERRAALETLQTSVSRATRLVEQLLQLARCSPEAAGSQPQETFRLDALARQNVVEFADIAAAQGIDLGLLSSDAAWIHANRADLQTVLGNLIDNAIRYGKPGGQVDVSVEAMGNKACLQIADNGPGIPDGDKPRVFDRFHRLAGADIPGSGLGLAIVREIVVQQGGEIHLQDTPGGGLTVVVSLPLADAPLSTPNL